MSSPTVATAPSAKAALWEDFVDIFYAPSKVYERRRDGRFGPALLVGTVVTLVLFFAFRAMFAAITDVAIEQSMRANADATPEQIAAARKASESFGPVMGAIQALFGYPLLIALSGLLLWLVSTIFGSTQKFAQAMTIAAYANVPRLLGTVVSGTLFSLGHPERVASPYSTTLSPVRLVDESTLSAITAALLSRFDLFTLWTTLLVGVGLHVIGGLAKSKAALAAALTWLVATAFLVLSAARQG